MFVFENIKKYNLKIRVDLIKYNSKEINTKLIPSPMEVIPIPNKTLTKFIKKKK